MAITIDTSLWIELVRDRSGRVGDAIAQQAGAEQVVMLSPVRMELLQGCRGDSEWNTLLSRIERFEIACPSPSTWDTAARIYFDLRQRGRSVRSAVDCLIAATAIERSLRLLHDDRDFEVIAGACQLCHNRLDTSKA